MGQANRRGTKEARKALAIQRDQLAIAERLEKRQAEWDAMTIEEKSRYLDKEMWLASLYSMTSPYLKLRSK